MTEASGFRVTITVTTDDIPDVLAFGKALHFAEDGTSDSVTTEEEAAKEVGWLLASFVGELTKRTGVYAEASPETVEILR